MATKIRAEISKKSPYWISKHRYYELKHFCLQYQEWSDLYFKTCRKEEDPTGEQAVVNVELKKRMNMIETAANRADDVLAVYILKAVTQERSYTYLYTVDRIPCSRDVFYDRYRKFFYILSHLRE